jgi:PAS domain S-box-containing protein
MGLSDTRRMPRFFKYVLPQGRALPQGAWNRRHRVMLGLLWAHAAGIPVFGLARGYSLGHSLLEASPVAAAAAFAAFSRGSRRMRSGAATLGVMTSSAVLVHLSGGVIEVHFHFFVMLSIIAIYNDWFPFLLALAYVVLHHGIIGVLYPGDVYNHPAAINNPWKWAVIHGVFILMASGAGLVAWRLAEEARARAELILDSAGEGILGLTEKGEISFANPKAAAMLACAPSDLVGKRAHDVLGHTSPDGTPHAPEHCPIQATLRDCKQRIVRDDLFSRKGGTSFLVDYTASPAVQDDGEVQAVVTFVDVTDQREVQSRLMRTNAELQQEVHTRTQAEETLRAQAELLDLTQDSILVRGLDDDRIHYWNRGSEETYGWTKEEALGQVAPDLLKTEFPQPLSEIKKEVRARGRWEGELVQTRRDGSRIVVASRWALKGGPDSGGDTVLQINTDVTERKQAEAALHHARDEAERANQAKSEFLSRMSHELRTPMNSILGFGQLLELEELSSGQREEVEHILKAGRHLLGLIDEVLDISRIESGQMSLSLEPVQVAQSVREVLQLIEPMAAERKVRLSVALEDFDSVHIRCDRQRFSQVLLNFLSNAMKYNRENGEVDVWLERKETKARISVRDTGFGIPEGKMGDLFKPFNRLGMDQSPVEGTGLGLALCKRLTELMGGKLGVESVQGQGSTFWVEFPLVRAPTATQGEDSRAALVHQGTQGEHSVLYIEDNLANLHLVEQILQHRPGITLMSAMQGTIGLELARQHHPDIVLLDLHLPDMGGDEALKQLRNAPETEDIEVVVVSADATEGQKRRLLEAGASDYLTKPLDVNRFIDVVDRSLAMKKR